MTALGNRHDVIHGKLAVLFTYRTAILEFAAKVLPFFSRKCPPVCCLPCYSAVLDFSVKRQILPSVFHLPFLDALDSQLLQLRIIRVSISLVLIEFVSVLLFPDLLYSENASLVFRVVFAPILAQISLMFCSPNSCSFIEQPWIFASPLSRLGKVFLPVTFSPFASPETGIAASSKPRFH